jgi:MSHA biogenesis protein MshK
MVLVLLAGTASAQVFNDPMRPPAYAPVAGVASAPEWQLTSVIISRDRRVAVINGETVTIGSSVGNAAVVNIKPSAVVLERNGEEILVNLLPVAYKTPTEAGKK